MMLAGLRPESAAVGAALGENEALGGRVLAALGEPHRRGGSKAGPLALEIGVDVRAVREALERASERGQVHAAKSGSGATIWRPGPGPARASVRAAPTPGAPAPSSAEKLPPVGSGADGDQAEEGEDELPDEDGSDEGASDAGDGEDSEDSEDEDDDGELPADANEAVADAGSADEDDTMRTEPATTKGSRMNGAATTKTAKPARPAAPPARRHLAPIVERVVTAMRENKAPMRSADIAQAIGETVEGTKAALRLLRDRGGVHASPSAGVNSAWSLGAAAKTTSAKDAGRVALAPASARQAHKQSKPKPVNVATPAASPATRRTSMRPAAPAAPPDDALPALVLELLRADPNRLRDVVRVLDLVKAGRP